MNAVEILKILTEAGALVEVESENLKVTTPKGNLSENHIKLIKENKETLLKFLTGRSSSSLIAAPNNTEPSIQNSQYYFEEYQPSGEVIRLTRLEFEELSDFFRALISLNKKSKGCKSLDLI